MTAILTSDQLRHFVPSAFAIQPWERMSHRYRMVPTSEVITILGERGFRPVKAMQSRSRIPGKADYTRHMIRFRHDQFLAPTVLGQEMPELVLTNSHDGTAAYRFNSGVFRLVCLNGLTVATADFGGISVRHKGGEDFSQRIIDATYQIIDETPRTMAQVEGWKQIKLTPPQQLAFAEAAAELRGTGTVEPKALLAPRRYEDRQEPNGSRDLWKTFNTTQEHLIKGGVQGIGSNGRRMTTRPVKAVEADVKTNKALWLLATRMAELAG